MVLGSKMTEESRKRMSLSHLGKKNPELSLRLKGQTYEQRYGVERAALLKKKNSDSQRGRTSCMKGKTYAEIYGPERALEMLKNQSLGHMGKTAGTHPSDAARKKNSDALKLLWKDPEYVTKVMQARNTPEAVKRQRESKLGSKNPMYGRVHSPAERAAISERTRGEKNPFYGKSQSADGRRRISESMRGPKNRWYGKGNGSVLAITRSANARRGVPLSDEHKKKDSDSMKLRWDDPAYILKATKARQIARSNFGKATGPNKSEAKLQALLEQLFPNEYQFVGAGYEFILARKIPDFVNINGQKKIIELYGDYWHEGDDPDERIQLFKQFGWHTLVIWEKELGSPAALSEKLVAFNAETQHENQ